MLAQVTSDTTMKNSFVEILEAMGAEKKYHKPRFCNASVQHIPRVDAPGSAMSIELSETVWTNCSIKNLQTISYFYKLQDGQSAHIHINGDFKSIVFVDKNITYICGTEYVKEPDRTQCVILSQEADAW